MENWIFNYNSENFDFGGGGTQEFVEVANFGALPVTGDSGVIYVTLDTNKLYRWSGTTYVEISPMEIPLLSSVLDVGNASGPNDISFDAGQGLYFANSSRLREGTIDASLGGAKGISQICAVGYELKWEAGRLYVMDGNGTGIRQSLYNFTNVPTVNDDVTKGYAIGSLWTLDDNTTYECSNATTGAAVWAIKNPEDKTDDYILEFKNGSLTTTIDAPYNGMKINSVTNVSNSPTTTITTGVGLTPYVLGTAINLGTIINITVSTASTIRLNSTKA